MSSWMLKLGVEVFQVGGFLELFYRPQALEVCLLVKVLRNCLDTCASGCGGTRLCKDTKLAVENAIHGGGDGGGWARTNLFASHI